MYDDDEVGRGRGDEDGGSLSHSIGEEDRSEGSSSDEDVTSESGPESGSESGLGDEGGVRHVSNVGGEWDAGLAGLPGRRRWQDRPLPVLEVGLGAFEAAMEDHRRFVSATGEASDELGDAMKRAVVGMRREVDALHKAAWTHAQLLQKVDALGAAVESRRRALVRVAERRREVDDRLSRLSRLDERGSEHEARLWRAHWLVGGLGLLAHRLADRAEERRP